MKHHKKQIDLKKAEKEKRAQMKMEAEKRMMHENQMKSNQRNIDLDRSEWARAWEEKHS